MSHQEVVENVRRYYDRQTRAFLALGQGGQAGSIHRAVWGPGVSNRQQAFRYIEDRLAALIRQFPPDGGIHVVDLGCGVAASLCYLAEAIPLTGTGITLSPVQARMGTERIGEAGLSGRLRCIEGDYCALPRDLEPATVAYAIESFVHGPDPARFFSECRRLVRPGGLLVLCDDFQHAGTPAKAHRALQQFREGWCANSLLTPDAVKACARDAGFALESTIDLSAYLEIRRLRDRAVDAMLALFGWLPWHRTPFAHLVGGSALQRCLAEGWIRYEFVVFRRLP